MGAFFRFEKEVGKDVVSRGCFVRVPDFVAVESSL